MENTNMKKISGTSDHLGQGKSELQSLYVGKLYKILPASVKKKKKNFASSESANKANSLITIMQPEIASGINHPLLRLLASMKWP